MRSLAVANQKGGVGKTTTAIHLAHGLAIQGKRVALFDLDPQGNASVALQGMSTEADSTEPLRVVQERFLLLESPGLEHQDRRAATPEVAALAELSARLEQDGLDWLVVDCPPRMDEWGWAGLQICSEVLIPVQAEFFAMHGLSQMLATLDLARREYPGRGRLLGILPTIVDWREQVCREVVQDLRSNLGRSVMESAIFKDMQVVEAASHGVTVFAHNPFSKAALCFCELIREVVDGRS